MSKCVDCKERKVGCHSICEYYIEWKKEHDKQQKLIKRKERESKAWVYFRR